MRNFGLIGTWKHIWLIEWRLSISGKSNLTRELFLLFVLFMSVYTVMPTGHAEWIWMYTKHKKHTITVDLEIIAQYHCLTQLTKCSKEKSSSIFTSIFILATFSLSLAIRFCSWRFYGQPDIMLLLTNQHYYLEMSFYLRKDIPL